MNTVLLEIIEVYIVLVFGLVFVGVTKRSILIHHLHILVKELVEQSCKIIVIICNHLVLRYFGSGRRSIDNRFLYRWRIKTGINDSSCIRFAGQIIILINPDISVF